MVNRLFGDDGDDPRPLWFNRDAFMAPSADFDPDAYIGSLRSFVPLDTLRTELTSHLSALKHELVELINRDYNDFVNLSTNLVDVDGAVRRMRAPLQDLRANLVSVRDSVEGSLLAVQDALKRRSEATESREILELLLDISHVVSKIEKLLQELSGMQSLDHTDLSLEESRSTLLERIASEMNRLKFYVARAHDSPFVKIVAKRIKNADALLGQNLRRCFELALDRRDDKVLYHCLRAYAAVDDTAGAEDAFRCTIVAPILQKVFPSSANKASSAPGEKLEDSFGELQRYIQSDCKFLLDIAASENSGLHVFNFLGNSILKEVQSAIQKAKPGALSPGKPDEFLENYRASMRFLDFVEGFCRSETEILKLRSEVAYADYVKLWNLGVYFTLRFQEIAGSLDSALTSDLRRAEEDTFLFISSMKLSECLQRCWDGDIYIPALSDKFLRLVLQLIHRYITWVSYGLTSRKDASAVTWASSASLNDLLLLRRDVELLHEKINGPYVEHVLEVLTPAAEKALGLVKQSIIQAGEGLLNVAAEVTDVLVANISDKCCEGARMVKTLTTTYRMTSKPVPTRPSSYATNILQELKSFVARQKDHLTDASRLEMITSVVTKVTAYYEQQIRELVESARKTETSLLRFRHARQQKAGTGTEKNELTDVDKVIIQVFLDVEEYGRQIDALGLALSGLACFQGLLRYAEDNKRAVHSSAAGLLD